VDDLLIRREEGDLEAAIQMLETALDPNSGIAMAHDAHAARLAWAKAARRRHARSFELFKSLEAALDLDPVWGYRMARAFVEAAT
jgi:hypothetical protein